MKIDPINIIMDAYNEGHLNPTECYDLIQWVCNLRSEGTEPSTGSVRVQINSFAINKLIGTPIE